MELGITHLDTALIYGMGHNETLVGKAVAGLSKEERARLCIATKTGLQITPDLKPKGTFSLTIKSPPNPIIERF